MHTEALLNPFFNSDYATQDDGQDHSVFTSVTQDVLPIIE
jgi:hypothetical protein